MSIAPTVPFDPDLIKAYSDLLILQYRDKPKARSHVAIFVKWFSVVSRVTDQLDDMFDIDNSYGVFLDIIGKIVGVPRTVDHHVDKPYFGFDPGELRRGMDTGKLFDFRVDFLYTESALTDAQYRFFIRCKIAKNCASAKLADQHRISLQDAIRFALSDQGYIVDNKDMTCTVFLHDTLDPILIEQIALRDLLPRPQGVRYIYQVITAPTQG